MECIMNTENRKNYINSTAFQRRLVLLVMLIFILVLILVFFVGLSLQIPVYKTFTAKVTEQKDTTFLEIDANLTKSSEPIYLYESREKTLTKITKYQIKKHGIEISKSKISFTGITNIHADIQVGTIPLLKLIFFKGGNA